MEEKLFERLLESTKEAVEISQGKKKPSRVFYYVGNETIKTIRKNKLFLSQDRFAQLLGVSVRTLQEWEQGRRQPSGPAQSLLKIAAYAPQTLLEALSTK